MLWRGTPVLAALMVLSSCSDRHSPVEPVDSVSESPMSVESNGGKVPLVISTRMGDTEELWFTFDNMEGQGGAHRPVDGSSYGVSFGYPDGDQYPSGNAYWAEGIAHIFTSYAPRQSFIEFDPPVRSATLDYHLQICAGFNGGSGCVDDFWARAYTESFVTVDIDTLYHDPPGGEYWTEITFSDPLGRDRIRWMWFQGILDMDNLRIVRAAPPVLECGSAVTRGDEATCMVDIGQQDTVQLWRFTGQMPPNFQTFPVEDDSSQATEWTGIAALSGLVEVEVLVGGDSVVVYSDSLLVQPRDLDAEAAWDWDDKWHYAENQGLDCALEWLPFDHPGPPDIGPDTLATSNSSEDCQISQIGPRMNDTLAFEATYMTDSIPTGPNAGLIYVDSATYHMRHGSFKNPHVRPTAAGNMVSSSQNLRDCKKHYGNVSSLTLNIHEFNLNCTKGQGPTEFLDWWDAVERHEAYGTAGKGPEGNGHQAQRELAAGDPLNDPYKIAEGMVRNSSRDLRNFLGPRIAQADNRIATKAGEHDVVNSNFGTLQQGQYCGDIFVYWTQPPPKEYASTEFCDDI